MMWNGIKNGQLLVLLEENNFDAWIVVDKNIPYQQNLKKLPCMVIVIDVFRNTLKHLFLLIPQILYALNNPGEEKIMIVK